MPYEKDLRKINEDKKDNEPKVKYQNMNKAMKIEKEKTVKNANQGHINEALSFLSDLSLSNLDIDKNFTKKEIIKINTASELFEDEKDNELIDNMEQSSLTNKDYILCKKDIEHLSENFEEKINFNSPSSILAPIIKLKNDKEIQKKLKKMQDKFNLKSFLRKEIF